MEDHYIDYTRRFFYLNKDSNKKDILVNKSVKYHYSYYIDD